MRDGDAGFLEGLFKKYYFENASSIAEPSRMQSREFGYQRFNGGMIRHISLKSANEMRLLLISNAPSDAYCSSAYYTLPELEMNQKDWQGADLVFDIDAKDLRLDCRSKHTMYKCSSCGAVSGDAHACGNCDSPKYDAVSVACSNCIDESKKEVEKLKEILVSDLGVEESAIRTYFSGNEGFHVHAEPSGYEDFNSRERGELANYIRFMDPIPERFGVSRQQKDIPRMLPGPGESGWPGRVARFAFGTDHKRKKFIASLGQNKYEGYGAVLRSLSAKIGAAIDPSVTMDVHRIFRMPRSLNGKSGLLKMPCDDLKSFDPYAEACVLDDAKVTVSASCMASFKLGGRKFGPYDSKEVQVPAYAAAYMICKGLASTVDAGQ